MPDPRGPWNINANGYAGLLWIEGIDPAGNIITPSSTVFGQEILGFWHEPSQKISFVRVIDKDDPSTIQVYTGYMMQSQADGSLAMSGSFEAFQGTSATAKRVVYGWYATRPSP